MTAAELAANQEEIIHFVAAGAADPQANADALRIALIEHFAVQITGAPDVVLIKRCE